MAYNLHHNKAKPQSCYNNAQSISSVNYRL